MAKKSDPKFRMRMDEKGTEAIFAEERNDLKVEKLAHKVTIISILIPVLIGVILVVSYLDIKSRVSTVKDTGESGVQSLSQNLESRFSSLSVKFATLEEKLEDKFEQADKSQLALQKRVKETEKSVRWLNKIKAARKTFKQKSAEIDANLEAIRTDLKTLDSNLNSLDQSVKQELADLVTLVEKSSATLIGFQAQVAGKIDRTEAETLIAKQQKALTASLDALGLRLEKQIVLNRQKIAAVKEKIGTRRTPAKKKTTSKKAPVPKTVPETVEKPSPAPKTAPRPDKPAEAEPKPGEIVEQDL